MNSPNKLATEYSPFILAILVTTHPATIVKRLSMESISWPSVYHARAWREFKELTREMIPVVQLSLELNTNELNKEK